MFRRELFSYLKPESVRVHPEATVRPWATCQVVGDALSFAAALGYVQVFSDTRSVYCTEFDPILQSAVSNIQARICFSTGEITHFDVSAGTGISLCTPQQ